MSEFNPILYMDCVIAIRSMSDDQFFQSQHNFDTKNWSYAWKNEYSRRFN